jgi:hypothetical protein
MLTRARPKQASGGFFFLAFSLGLYPNNESPEISPHPPNTVVSS